MSTPALYETTYEESSQEDWFRRLLQGGGWRLESVSMEHGQGYQKVEIRAVRMTPTPYGGPDDE